MTNTIIDKNEIAKYLNSSLNILTFDEINSTNDYAKKIAEKRPDTATLIVSDHQTAGYGRFKRDFYSPANTGIYMSLLLPINKVETDLLTLKACVATVKALQLNFPNADLKIKWINDILLNNKKISGILAESISDGKNGIAYVVLGIGVNLNTADFPQELHDIASSITDSITLNRNKIIGDIVNEFFKINHAENFLAEYIRLCGTIGKRVELVNGNQHIVGTAEMIKPDGSLVIKDDKKNLHCFNSGEITKVYLK
ncbi:biotin--[acetyl-CoA-carboxylase] ligase [Companilactobacillus mishanensis]|uniref:biotin--[biotin carboxyl-carrier protein] ligase n=1 Tax=Companilactobacillus mishanensis TaxID=2486008 RepID=A0A5P0ZJ28_9LACO|nr:biotin--[acetyl-CoA-carboxylase] ligase [Companilactobacillus mishanensis]MQS53111.1 biotin--[acetyl-CoA-carboxylase] ligase [Companilactobacillus mishanensis]